MRKIPIKLLTILVLSTVFSGIISAKTHALYIGEDNTTWYTVPEMLDYKEIIDQEEQNLCGNDMNCQQEFYFNKFETDEKFRALDQLTQQQIVVTSVNPEAEILKVLFFDEDMMLKRMGISTKLKLIEFYMGWFEYDVERIYNYGSYTDKLFSDTMPGAHLIYAQRDNNGDKIPSNKEIEIYAPGSNLQLNSSGEIAYGVIANQFNAAGRFIFTSCLREPDYQDSTGCHLMLSGDQGYRYFPPRETLLNETTENHIEQEEINELLSDEEAKEQIGNEAPNSENMLTQESNNAHNNLVELTDIYTAKAENLSKIKAEENVAKSDNSFLGAPDTGESNKTPEKVTIMPWWIIFLSIISIYLIVWWFTPTKNEKNYNKIHKKC